MLSRPGLEPEVPYDGYHAQPSNAAAVPIGGCGCSAVRGGSAGVKAVWNGSSGTGARVDRCVAGKAHEEQGCEGCQPLCAYQEREKAVRAGARTKGSRREE